MSKAWLTHGLRCAALVAFGVVLAAPAARGGPVPGARRRAPALFSGFLGRMNVNRWDCGLDATGHVCVDPKGSTTVGGGFWPSGTPDQYVFGSGIQVAGVVDPASGFAWAGDTTAAFFEDPSGAHENGEQLSLIWQSNNPTDVEGWPRDAHVPNDTSLYAPVLIGRVAASQEDAWARYWDGNPNRNAGRPHPLGVLVDERGMAWNFPSGNEDIQYWIFTITNITASKASVYAGRPDADSLALLGARFKAANDPAFAVSIPDTGYTITDGYFAFAMDADVDASDAKSNFTTAFLPFNMGIAFKSNWFTGPRVFEYPSTIFSPPFAPTSGEVGVKYLKSPLKNPANPALGEIGLVLYSATVNAGAFGDAANAAQLYRYLSGTLNTALGDAPCTYTHKAPGQLPKDYHICYIATAHDDVRFFQSSGPFTLAPGQSQTIAVAYIGAAPVDNPAIAGRSPTFIYPPAGPDAEQPESLAAGIQHLTGLDSIFGALTIVGDTGGAPGGGPNGRIDQTEITVVPRSLLGKGLVAQAVFDAHFLLPFPPAAPRFYALPGDNQVTIVWDRSPTETTPDPYYAVASDITSQLYDPNYRDLDVQGYRVYRGRTSGNLELVAQFDYAGKEFIDRTAALQYGNCAPELGLTADCPADLAAGHHVPIASPFVQIPPGGRVELAQGTTATGNVLVIQADTAVTGGGTGGTCKPSACLILSNGGMPFAFVDKGVKNGFTYYYTVAAFDVNSVKSTGVGYTSLEGRAAVKTVVPRKPSSNTAATTFKTVVLGDDGAVLDPTAPYPPINATNGTFSANMPPVNGVSVVPGGVTELLGVGVNEKVVIDSVTSGFAGGIGPPGPTVYMRFIGARGDTLRVALPTTIPDFTDAVGSTKPFGTAASVVPYDTIAGKAFGLTKSFMDTTRIPVSFGGITVPISQNASAISVIAGRYGVGTAANRYLAHSRWSDEGGAEPANPTIVGLPDSSHNSGKLTGVGRIWAPQAYRDRGTGAPATPIGLFLRGYSYGQANWYPADFTITWNADSSISVRDVTHHVNLPLAPNGGAGWGFMNIRAYTAAGVTAGDLDDGTGTTVLGNLSYQHIFGTPPTCDGYFGIGCITLEAKAQFEPIDFNYDGTADANGIGLIINGEAFIMEMSAIPAAGTKWHLRDVSGDMNATCVGGFAVVMTSCSGYSFTGFSPRPPLVPNLAFAFQVTKQYHADSAAAGDLSKIHTVPDPYYVTNAFEQTTSSKTLHFVNLPSQAIIRIYSLSGILVKMITINDATGGGEAQWDLRNRNNQFVASGVYFYHVETRDGQSKVGRFTIVNFAQ